VTPCLHARPASVVGCRGVRDLASERADRASPADRCVVEWGGARLHFCLHSPHSNDEDRESLDAPDVRAGASGPARCREPEVDERALGLSLAGGVEACAGRDGSSATLTADLKRVVREQRRGFYA
jgi:hypothetical protein